MRRRVTFEHPETLTTSTAIDVVPPPMWRHLVLYAMAPVNAWRADEMAAACARDLLQSAFTFWQRDITPPLGSLEYHEEDDIIEVDITMIWAVTRIDSVKHNMC